MPLCHFCSIVNHMPSFPWLHQLCLFTVTYCWTRLNGESITSISEFWMSNILEWFKLRDTNMALMSSFTYKISSKSIHRFKSYTHLRGLNVCHFEILEVTGLKVWHLGHLQRHHLHTKFHLNPPIGSNVTSNSGVCILPLWNSWSYDIKNVVSRSPSMSISVQNFIKTHQSVQKLLEFFSPTSQI
jgi:hypothetical protein